MNQFTVQLEGTTIVLFCKACFGSTGFNPGLANHRFSIGLKGLLRHDDVASTLRWIEAHAHGRVQPPIESYEAIIAHYTQTVLVVANEAYKQLLSDRLLKAAGRKEG